MSPAVRAPPRTGTGEKRPQPIITPQLWRGEFDRHEDNAMTKFLARYQPRIAAVLSGFDRLVFRGTLLPLVMRGGMFCFLQRAQVGLLDFGEYVRATSERVKVAALGEAVAGDRPVRYLESSTLDKEKLARRSLSIPSSRG